MSLKLTVELPAEIEERLRRETPDLEGDVKSAYALELFRGGRVTHVELSHMLGMDRFETDAYLKQHGVFEGSLTMEELDSDPERLAKVMGERL